MEAYERILLSLIFALVPTAADLRSLMAQHGGTFHAYRSSRVTHIVATKLAESKARGLTTQKVVRPEWIMDR